MASIIIHLWRHLFTSETQFLAYTKFYHKNYRFLKHLIKRFIARNCFSGEQCGPWASCYWLLVTWCQNTSLYYIVKNIFCILLTCTMLRCTFWNSKLISWNTSSDSTGSVLYIRADLGYFYNFFYWIFVGVLRCPNLIMCLLILVILQKGEGWSSPPLHPFLFISKLTGSGGLGGWGVCIFSLEFPKNNGTLIKSKGFNRK